MNATAHDLLDRLCADRQFRKQYRRDAERSIAAGDKAVGERMLANLRQADDFRDSFAFLQIKLTRGEMRALNWCCKRAGHNPKQRDLPRQQFLQTAVGNLVRQTMRQIIQRGVNPPADIAAAVDREFKGGL